MHSSFGLPRRRWEGVHGRQERAVPCYADLAWYHLFACFFTSTTLGLALFIFTSGCRPRLARGTAVDIPGGQSDLVGRAISVEHAPTDNDNVLGVETDAQASSVGSGRRRRESGP